MPRKTTLVPAAPPDALPVENVPSLPHDRNAALPAMSDGEVSWLAKKLSAEYEQRLDHYTSVKRRRDNPECTVEQQYDMARERCSKENAEQIIRQTSNQALTWGAVEDIFSHDPELWVRKWEEVKEEARQEVARGVYASNACMPEDTPWARAQFIALRNDFADGYEPRNGIEWNFIDQMASAYTMVLFWQKIMLRWMNSEAFHEPRRSLMEVGAPPPRLSTFEAVNRAAEMIDRFQRMFMRCVRGLLSMRRMPVIVQNAGQVNVGAQQVNMGAQTA